MPVNSDSFFAAALSAGGILSGFCGTFLTFRIQREASYYRQAAVDFHEGKGKDIFVGLTHFSSAFFILLLATLCSATFGFVFPLLALHGSAWFAARSGLVVEVMIGVGMSLCAYFTYWRDQYCIITGEVLTNATHG